MKIQQLLSSLDGTVTKGKNRWVARCPAHDDRRPSLAVSLEDDRVLIHCFAGCTPHEVVGAIGMELSDLFPETNKHHSTPLRNPFNANQILTAIGNEMTVFLTLVSDVEDKNYLSVEAENRLNLMLARVGAALEMNHG